MDLFSSEPLYLFQALLYGIPPYGLRDEPAANMTPVAERIIETASE